MKGQQCELCVDCDNITCGGKQCHKDGPCVIAEDCFNPECRFSHIQIPIFDKGGGTDA